MSNVAQLEEINKPDRPDVTAHYCEERTSSWNNL